MIFQFFSHINTAASITNAKLIDKLSNIGWRFSAGLQMEGSGTRMQVSCHLADHCEVQKAGIDGPLASVKTVWPVLILALLDYLLHISITHQFP